VSRTFPLKISGYSAALMQYVNTVKLGDNEQLQKPFVITGIRYNRVNMCSKWTFVTELFVRYYRVRYNRV